MMLMKSLLDKNTNGGRFTIRAKAEIGEKSLGVTNPQNESRN